MEAEGSSETLAFVYLIAWRYATKIVIMTLIDMRTTSLIYWHTWICVSETNFSVQSLCFPFVSNPDLETGYPDMSFLFCLIIPGKFWHYKNPTPPHSVCVAKLPQRSMVCSMCSSLKRDAITLIWDFDLGTVSHVSWVLMLRRHFRLFTFFPGRNIRIRTSDTDWWEYNVLILSTNYVTVQNFFPFFLNGVYLRHVLFWWLNQDETCKACSTHCGRLCDIVVLCGCK
jgi:hypothetical protein